MRSLYWIFTLTLGTTLAFAQADNTRMNKRDAASSTVTAGKQGGSKADLELTRKIRKALTNDTTLTTYGKNLKVVSVEGKVTLRGPVHSEDEKARIEGLATTIAGPSNVTNQIEVVKTGKK